MSSPLVIIMDGGVIQSVHTSEHQWSHPVVVIDLDTEDADPDDLTVVPGPEVDMLAYVSEADVYFLPPQLEDFAWDFLEGQAR